MSNEVLALPTTVEVPLRALANGETKDDKLQWNGTEWKSTTTLTLTTPPLTVPVGVLESTAYQAKTMQNGNHVNTTGVLTLNYTGAFNDSILLNLPIDTTNWIVGFNQFNATFTSESTTATSTAKVWGRMNSLSNHIQIFVKDVDNVGANFLHIHYNINYLITVATGLNGVLE